MQPIRSTLQGSEEFWRKHNDPNGNADHKTIEIPFQTFEVLTIVYYFPEYITDLVNSTTTQDYALSSFSLTLLSISSLIDITATIIVSISALKLNLAWLTLGLVYAFGKVVSFVIEYVIAKLFNMFSWHVVPHFVFKFLILMVYYSFWKEIKNVEGDYGLELNFEPS
ncbi:uncharacterized protein LOC106660984 isoform X6 [Cimex lectularius]|uniref:Uncharacterized protein n=1 Tax=Cimex lectularius TaxID=79782 RepID=A0A8I6R718_CIMLE|nr:uncharacterized protein LOC106660984 isoform X6 [Cimex lectularius]